MSNFKNLSLSDNQKGLEQNPDIIILKYGTPDESNIFEWSKKCEIDFLAKYGEVAEFFSTNKYHKFVLPSDTKVIYDKNNDPNKVLRELRKTALSEHYKKITAAKQSYSKIWGDMESRMSERSLDVVRSNANYNTLKQKYKVVEYLRLIKQVHRSEPAVISPDETLDDALTKYYSIRQSSDESLTDYKNRFIAAIERIETADSSKKPTESEVARRFTRYLDPVRFKNLIQETAKDQTKYKATLAEAHEQAFSERRMHKGVLVPCETVTRDTKIAGVTTDLQLSKNEIKTILQIRAGKTQHDANASDSNKKRKYDNDGDIQPSLRNVNITNNNKNNNNKNNKNKFCDICQMNNHNTNECRKLSKVQEMFKPRKRSDYGRDSSNRNDYGRDTNRPSGGYQPRYYENNNYSSSNVPSKQVHYNNCEYYERSHDDNRRNFHQSVYYTDQRDDRYHGYMPEYNPGYSSRNNRSYTRP